MIHIQNYYKIKNIKKAKENENFKNHKFIKL